MKDTISEADFSAEGIEEKKDKKKEAKKFLFKGNSKDKGYASLTGYTSQESIFLVNTKESKKSKPDHKITTLNVFKKSFKEEKRLKDIKESKEEPKRSKKSKEKSGEKHKRESLFGNYLENAIISFPSNDGVKIPYPIRICLDIIEQKGIENENIYRHTYNKSQVEAICDAINKDIMDTKLDELNAEPTLACAIVKKFFKELKSSLIPDEFVNVLDKCDSSISDKDMHNKVEHVKKILFKLPQANFDCVAYLLMHFYRILNKHEVNKVEIGIFVQKFLPMFKIRERLFKFMIAYADLLLNEYRFKKYRLKGNDENTISRFSFLPESIEELEQEICKQEVYLSKLHAKIANEQNSADTTKQEQLSEELWALQRYVTSLKRKVKKLKQERKAIENEQIKNLTEAMSSGDKNQEDHHRNADSSTTKSEMINEQNMAEYLSKEMNLVCENSVLIESIVQLLDKINREKQMISEFQQRINTSSGNGTNNLVLPVGDDNLLKIEELYESEQVLINENKLLEERINLINKRINNEKEKILELKLNIKLKTLKSNSMSLVNNEPQQNNLAKIILDLNAIGGSKAKDLITTKL